MKVFNQEVGANFQQVKNNSADNKKNHFSWLAWGRDILGIMCVMFTIVLVSIACISCSRYRDVMTMFLIPVWGVGIGFFTYLLAVAGIDDDYYRRHLNVEEVIKSCRWRYIMDKGAEYLAVLFIVLGVIDWFVLIILVMIYGE